MAENKTNLLPHNSGDQKSEINFTEPELRCWQGRALSGGPWWESFFILAPSGGSWPPLVSGSMTTISAPSSRGLPPCVSVCLFMSSPLLKRIQVTRVRLTLHPWLHLKAFNKLHLSHALFPNKITFFGSRWTGILGTCYSAHYTALIPITTGIWGQF